MRFWFYVAPGISNIIFMINVLGRYAAKILGRYADSALRF